jgi:nitroreductase
MIVAVAEKPITTPAMTAIVRAATLAPSPDNNQPWWFVVGDDELTVHLDRTHSLPSDVDHMFDLLGLGAAIENASLAAGAQRYSATVTYLVGDRVPATADRYCPIARLRFSEGGQQSPLAQWIEQRATCRRPYDSQPIPSEKLDAIADAASTPTRSVSEDEPDTTLDWLTELPGIKTLSKLVAKADGLRFRYRAFHDELYRQLRFTPAEAEATRDGLDVRTFELPPPAVWALRWLRPWQRMRALHVCGLGGLLSAPSGRLVRQSAAIGVLTVGRISNPSHSPPTARDYLIAGRALQRAWLAATSLGLSVHPLGSLPIFLAQRRRMKSKGDGDRPAAPVEPTVLQRLGDGIDAAIPQTNNRALVMLFRLGQAPPPSARSLRRPIDRVLPSVA